MTKHILLYEPKTDEGQLLAQHIEALGDDIHVTHARTMREACSVLTTRPHDLALLPVTRNDSLVYSLRMLQPNLPMYLMLREPEEYVPERQAQVVRGQILRGTVLESLPALLGLDAPDPPAPEKPKSEKAPPDIDRHRLTLLVQNSMLDERILVIVVSDGDEVIGFRHATHQGQIETIAQQLRRNWPANLSLTAQIQYMASQGENQQGLLLYSRPLWQNYLLTLGAVPHMPLAQMRHHANRIAEGLQKPGKAVDQTSKTATRPWQKSHAIVLKPQDPLNGEVLLALQELLPTLGREYGLDVHHIIAQPTFLHFIVTSTAQHSTAWLAQYFKTATTEALENLFDLPWPLWSAGYYAKETEFPLDQNELTFFAQS